MSPVEKTKSWIESFVIGLNLCPFAKHPFQKEQIRYRLEETDNLEKLAETLVEELFFLQKNEPEIIETTLIIHPHLLNDFLDYNDFLAVAADILVDLGLEGEIQIASFHPDYQFAGEHPEAASNYVTRSPFPMLHLLREQSVEKGIQTHPDTEKIPFDNIEKMNKLGKFALQSMLDNLK